MNNVEFFEKLFKNTEDKITRLLGEVLKRTGGSISELNVEDVMIFNECIKFKNELEQDCLSWAESQDRLIEDQAKSNKKTKIMLQTMAGMIERQRKLLERQSDQLYRIEQKLEKN